MNVEFLPVPGWPEYEINRDGVVRRVKAIRGARVGRVVKPWIGKGNGYFCVTLHRPGHREGATVHRLLALAFIPKPVGDRLGVAHWNGNRLDNRIENLRWATRVENSADREHTQTHSIGEANPCAKYSREQVEQVMPLRQRGLTYSEIGAALGIHKRVVGDIVCGRRWGKTAPDEKLVKQLREAKYGNART